MCGRFVLSASKDALQALFGVVLEGPFEARYNIVPSQPILYIHDFTGGGQDSDLWQCDYARWGLIPHWHKDPANASAMINARSETVTAKPSFKTAIRHRRVLVPATHFYEWRREGRHKQPYAVTRKHSDGDDGLYAMAGIVDEWAGADGSFLSTLAILTQEADGKIAQIHNRMPIVVPPDHYANWLDVRRVEPHQALEPLRVPQPNAWTLWPVDLTVNKGTVEGPNLLKPAAPVPVAKPEPKAQLDLF